MNQPTAIRLLRATGLDDDAIEGVAGEVSVVLARGLPPSLTHGDAWAEAVFHAFRAAQRKTNAGNGYYRMAARYGLRSMVVRERRALRLGDVPIVRNGSAWPFNAVPPAETGLAQRNLVTKRCLSCSTMLHDVPPGRKRCESCARVERRRRGLQYNRKSRGRGR